MKRGQIQSISTREVSNGQSWRRARNALCGSSHRNVKQTSQTKGWVTDGYALAQKEPVPAVNKPCVSRMGIHHVAVVHTTHASLVVPHPAISLTS